MKLRNAAFGWGRRWLLAAGLAGGMALTPVPISPVQVAPARAAEGEPVPRHVRDSIDKALKYLAAHQKPDGSFEQGPSAGTTAVPSLCVLAFLARGHVPGQGEYGEILNKSIDYILASQHTDGAYEGLVSRSPGGNQVMYEHGISTVMLAECYGMVDDDRRVKIGKALSKSARLILNAQTPSNRPKQMPYTGGWRYTVNSYDADISVTGWQMMALRGAANCGANIPKEDLEAAREYVRRSIPHDKGTGQVLPVSGFGYQPGQGPNQARTGTGILMMELFRGLDPTLAPGEHSAEAVSAGDWLIQADASGNRNNLPNKPEMEFYYYGIYYCSQAVNQLGGKYWDIVYAGEKTGLRAVLLGQQGKEGSFGGSNGQEQAAGPCYRTAMACLALCVPYRYLPIYQNDN